MWGRIVVAGTLLQHAIVPDSATPFDFQAAYGLSSQLVGVLPLRASAVLGAGTSRYLLSAVTSESQWGQHALQGWGVQEILCPYCAFPHRPRPSATITRWR